MSENSGGGGEIAIEALLAAAECFLDSGEDSRAVEQYRFILRLEPNATALYNLGSLCAQGRGTPRDFCEAAYYFRRAAEAGDERAAKLVLKCELDYIREGLESRSAGELYERMKAFSALAYPGDAPDARAARELSQLGQHHYNRRDYAAALKLLRAAAEFGCDGEAQNCLGLIYNAGAGVRRSDLVSLYWFDRAADSGVQAARRDRDGILNAYRATLSPEEFTDYMQRVARWCENGGPEVPRTPQKAAFWRRIAALK